MQIQFYNSSAITCVYFLMLLFKFNVLFSLIWGIFKLKPSNPCTLWFNVSINFYNTSIKIIIFVGILIYREKNIY